MSRGGNNIQNLIPIKKGHTLNPLGRPKGSISWNTLINKVVEGKITVKEAGKIKKMTKGNIMVMELIKMALDPKGKPSDRLKAMEIIFDRTEGKAIQKVEQETVNINLTKEDMDMKLIEIAEAEGITIEQLKLREGIDE
jgi:hypothetical protein